MFDSRVQLELPNPLRLMAGNSLWSGPYEYASSYYIIKGSFH